MKEQAEGEKREMALVVATLADRVVEAQRKLVATARASAVFGEPRTIGARTVIPVAEVMCGFGFGMGMGQEGAVAAKPGSTGTGGGGGGGARSRPVAVVVVEPERVRVKPIVNVTKISLAALAAIVMCLFMLRRLFRRRTA